MALAHRMHYIGLEKKESEKEDDEVQNGYGFENYVCNGQRWKGYLPYPEWSNNPRPSEGSTLSENDLKNIRTVFTT